MIIIAHNVVNSLILKLANIIIKRKEDSQYKLIIKYNKKN